MPRNIILALALFILMVCISACTSSSNTDANTDGVTAQGRATDAEFTVTVAQLAHDGTLDVAAVGLPIGHPQNYSYTLVRGVEYATLVGSILTAIPGSRDGTVIVRVTNGYNRRQDERNEMTIYKGVAKLIFVDGQENEVLNYGVITPPEGEVCVVGTTEVSYTFLAQGGTPDYEFTLASGFSFSRDLPGLTLDSEEGILSGIPEATIDEEATFEVRDQNNEVDTVKAIIKCGLPLTLDYRGGDSGNPDTVHHHDRGSDHDGGEEKDLAEDASLEITVSERSTVDIVPIFYNQGLTNPEYTKVPHGEAAAQGGIAPLCDDVDGELAAIGLGIDPVTCKITGTINDDASTLSPYTMTVRVRSEDGQSIQVELVLNIHDAPSLENPNLTIAVTSTADDESLGYSNTGHNGDTNFGMNGPIGGYKFSYAIDKDGDSFPEEGEAEPGFYTISLEALSHNSEAPGHIRLLEGTLLQSCLIVDGSGVPLDFSTGRWFFRATSSTHSCDIRLTKSIDGYKEGVYNYFVRVFDSNGSFVNVPFNVTLLPAVSLVYKDEDGALLPEGSRLSYTAADSHDANGVFDLGVAGIDGFLHLSKNAGYVNSLWAVDHEITSKGHVSLQPQITGGTNHYVYTMGGDITESEFTRANLTWNARAGILSGQATLPSSLAAIGSTSTSWKITAHDGYGGADSFEFYGFTIYPELDVFCTGTTYEDNNGFTFDHRSITGPIVAYDTASATPFAMHATTNGISQNRSNAWCYIAGGNASHEASETSQNYAPYRVSLTGTLPLALAFDEDGIILADAPATEVHKAATAPLREIISQSAISGTFDGFVIRVTDQNGAVVESNKFGLILEPSDTP